MKGSTPTPSTDEESKSGRNPPSRCGGFGSTDARPAPTGSAASRESSLQDRSGNEHEDSPGTGVGRKLKKKRKRAFKMSGQTKRWLANETARLSLEAATLDKRDITDDEVLAVLKEWSFRKNPDRRNVMPDGEDHVPSETFLAS